MPAVSPTGAPSRHAAARSLRPDQALLVNQLAHGLYRVLPRRFKTYCAFTAGVCQRVLTQLGIPAELQPCQLWHLGPARAHVIGFTGEPQRPGVWDGHVVCTAGHLLIDAATQHFEVQFGLPSPWVAVAALVGMPTQALARLTHGPGGSLLWLRAPQGMPVAPPPEPEALMQGYVSALVRQLAGPRSAPTGAPSSAGSAPSTCATGPRR